jgi:hypothetical protein
VWNAAKYLSQENSPLCRLDSRRLAALSFLGGPVLYGLHPLYGAMIHHSIFSPYRRETGSAICQLTHTEVGLGLSHFLGLSRTKNIPNPTSYTVVFFADLPQLSSPRLFSARVHCVPQLIMSLFLYIIIGRRSQLQVQH